MPLTKIKNPRYDNSEIQWDYERVDLASGDTVVETTPCLVKGVYINEQTSNHRIEIKDGSAFAYSVPASSPSGQAYDFSTDGVVYDSGIVVSPDPGATGNITVVYFVLN